MKKAITIVLAAAMLTACSVTAFAESITQNSDPKTGDTTVSYTVDPAYTVVIPESVTLSDTADVTETIKIYGKDENSNVVIPQGKKVNVALTNSTNGFNVKNADGDIIAYTVNDKSSADDLTAVAECAAGTKKNTDITFKKTGETKYAGTYTDTLTFGISVENAVISKTLTIGSLTITYHDGETWAQIAENNDNITVNSSGFVAMTSDTRTWLCKDSIGPDHMVSPNDVINPTANYVWW